MLCCTTDLCLSIDTMNHSVNTLPALAHYSMYSEQTWQLTNNCEHVCVFVHSGFAQIFNVKLTFTQHTPNIINLIFSQFKLMQLTQIAHVNRALGEEEEGRLICSVHTKCVNEQLNANSIIV